MNPIEPAAPGPEFHVTPESGPASSNRRPSNAENAMSANARSRDRQGRAEDRASHDRHAGMTPGAQAPSAPEARSISDACRDAEADGRGND